MLQDSYLEAGGWGWGWGWGWGSQKSIYSTGQFIRKPLTLQPNSLSPSFTASYPDRRLHKGNWHHIVRVDINPWYFHCSPLKFSSPSLLLGHSHRAGESRQPLRDNKILSDKDRKKEKKHKLQSRLVFSFFLSSLLLLFGCFGHKGP